MMQAKPLEAGALAPAFNYRTATGAEAHSSELAGRAYLVYFYPKDDTPGCTTEACGFRDAYDAFGKADLTVIGVSPDSEKSHQKFREKHSLPFALVADEGKAVCQAYGVWGEKKFMGRTFEGVHRMSFLVGPDGHIAKTYPKVKPDAHASEVLADHRSLIRKGN